MDDIDDMIGKYYREKMAQELEESLFSKFAGNDYEQETKWFNQGLRYAIIIIRHGID